MSLLELFCHVDAFCHTFLPDWDRQLRVHGQRSRRRSGRLAPSGVMTIMIHFHQVRFRDFKTYYRVYVLGHLRHEFPKAVSYQGFVERMPTTVGQLCAYLQTCLGSVPASPSWTRRRWRSAFCCILVRGDLLRHTRLVDGRFEERLHRFAVPPREK